MLRIRYDDNTTVEWPHSDPKPHINVDRIADLTVSTVDGYFDITKVMEAYPNLCINNAISQVFYGDIAKMILVNCFLME